MPARGLSPQPRDGEVPPFSNQRHDPGLKFGGDGLWRCPMMGAVSEKDRCPINRGESFGAIHFWAFTHFLVQRDL